MSVRTICNGCGKMGPRKKWWQDAPPGWEAICLVGPSNSGHLCEECVPKFKIRMMDHELIRAWPVALADAQGERKDGQA